MRPALLLALAGGLSTVAGQDPVPAPSGTGSPPTPAITVGPNVRVSADHGDEAHYETHAAAHPSDPSLLLATAILYPTAGRRGSVVYASRDGGATWATSLDGESLRNTGDPAVGYLPDGTGFFAALTLRGHPLEERPAEPAHNWDGRKTLLWRLPTNAEEWLGPATCDFADREYVVADGTGGERHGHVYLTGDPRPKRGFAVFTSTDGGRSFTQHGVEADIGGRSIGNAVVASDGRLIGIYADDEHVRAVWSTDGGATLQPSVVVDRYVQAGMRKDRRHRNVNHFLHLAIDASDSPHRDRLYAAWPDRRTGRSRVWFTVSDDRGEHWAEARPITDAPEEPPTDEFMPTLAVNRGGAVGLLWCDRRENADNRGFYPRFLTSLDGGAHWLPSVRLSTEPYAAGEVAQDSAFAENGGDTAGLAVTADGAFHPVWVDDRTGMPQVWTARVTVDRRPTGSTDDDGR